MTPARELDPEEFKVAKSHLTFLVIGFGTLSGGLDALRKLSRKMPATPGMAFVVVMHLSFEHESLLAIILHRSAALSIVTVMQSAPIEIDHIYVISPALKLVRALGTFMWHR